MHNEVSVVLPTYNRAQALASNFPSIASLKGILELIAVDDGSTDDTPDVLQAQHDERLRVLRRPRNKGSPAARNLGAAAARGEWVLFVEDDCRFPRDYAQTLRREAEIHAADVVGAPMVHASDERKLEAEVAAAKARREGDRGLDEVASFPPRPISTPLLPATSLVRRRIFDYVAFDDGYRGNAYREETDFFLRAAALGFECLLTPRTFFWEPRRWEGGQGDALVAAEYWTWRNNWRFLRRHGRWLAERGYISSALREQLTFMERRARRLVRVIVGQGA